MDFLCMYLTSKLLCPRASLLRQVAAAILGGAYATAALFLPLEYAAALLVDIAACLVMVSVAFFKRSEPYRVFLYAIVFAAISMTLGGIMTALFNLLNKTGLRELFGTDGDGISVWTFALLAVISGAMTLLGGGFFKGRMSAKTVDVEITLDGKTVKLRGMSDSGNMLRDPIGGRPCIVADRKAIASFLSDSDRTALEGTGAQDVYGFSPQLKKRIMLIPTKTATGEKLLLGIRADKVKLVCGKRSYEVDSPIAITDLRDGAGENRALVPSELLA